MILRRLTDDDLVKKHIGYFRGANEKYADCVTKQVKFKRVYLSKGDKSTFEFYGELVTFNNETDIKVLVPVDIIERSEPLKVVSGDFFMGKQQVNLSNPRMLTYRDAILMDMDTTESSLIFNVKVGDILAVTNIAIDGSNTEITKRRTIKSLEHFGENDYYSVTFEECGGGHTFSAYQLIRFKEDAIGLKDLNIFK